MSVVEEILRKSNDSLSFGNYLLNEKKKVENFEAFDNKYKVKTHKELTRLEKNDKMLLETLPGTAVHNFSENDREVSFSIEGFDNTQITLELEPNQEYKLIVDDMTVCTMEATAYGKITFSLDLKGDSKNVVIRKM